MILSSVACLDVQPYLFKLFHRQHDFRGGEGECGGGGIEHKMCVLILATNFYKTFIILKRIPADIIINEVWSSCKVPVILVRFS